jgi:uroporphyrinogen decarboxylase
MWFHPETAARLGSLLQIPPAFVPEAMGDDVRMTWVNNNYAMEGIVHEHEGEGHVDYWGITWTRHGGFNQVSEFPLRDASPEEVLRYHFPAEQLEALMERMAPVVQAADTHFIGCDVSPCVFEMYWRLRGMEQAMLDIHLYPDLAEEMFRRCADFSVLLSQQACDRFPLDWLWAGDDVASQDATLFSPETFRELVKPNLAKVFAVGKAHGLWTAYHSCGAIRPLIPDLIEIGLDVLNPIQCNAACMDPLELKQEFGSDLAFMGGVDTQDVLPFGTVDEVRKATARLIEGMTSDGGGYILAASHTVPPETPDENIFAMYAEAGIAREEIFDRAAGIRGALNIKKT